MVKPEEGRGVDMHDMRARALLVTQDVDSIHVTRPTRAGVPARLGRSDRPGVLRFSKERGPGRETLAACRAAVVRTPIILRLCWGPGGRGGELG